MTGKTIEEIRVEVRYSDGWYWWLRLTPIPLLFLYSYLVRVQVIPNDWVLPSALGMLGVLFATRYFAYRKRWVATLKPTGLYLRSGWGKSEKWTEVSWVDVQSVRSIGISEHQGAIHSRKIVLEYPSPTARGGPGIFNLWSAEPCFYPAVEALVQWVDPTKLDQDLMRIAEPANLEKLRVKRKSGFWMGFAVVVGAILASLGFQRFGWHPHLMNLVIAFAVVLWLFIWNRHFRK